MGGEAWPNTIGSTTWAAQSTGQPAVIGAMADVLDVEPMRRSSGPWLCHRDAGRNPSTRPHRSGSGAGDEGSARPRPRSARKGPSLRPTRRCTTSKPTRTSGSGALEELSAWPRDGLLLGRQDHSAPARTTTPWGRAPRCPTARPRQWPNALIGPGHDRAASFSQVDYGPSSPSDHERVGGERSAPRLSRASPT